MPRLPELDAALAALPSLPGRLCVGYSGGLDSTVLLHALHRQCRLPLRAIHVHHGLQAHADDWASHCRTSAEALGIPVEIVHVDATPRHGEGPEAAARQARRQAWQTRLAEDEWLTLAHHQDDQAETFLLHALRGSGPQGLAAMPILRPFAHTWLWRPLLRLPRAALQAYARAHRLDWVDDPSNADNALDRNYLRNEILPRLARRWPHAGAALANAARLCEEADALLSAEEDEVLASLHHRDDPSSLDIPALMQHPAARRARLLRRWIQHQGLPALPRDAIARIEQEMLATRSDATPQYLWQNAILERWRDHLHAGQQRPALPTDWSQHWDGTAPLPLPDGNQLCFVSKDPAAPAFVRPIQVRARIGGERIDLPGRSHSHALKKLLQARESALPPWLRRQLPLLFDPQSGQLLAVADRLFSRHFDAVRHPDARDARLVWHLA